MTLYLSQLLLNPRNRHVRQDLTDCHQLHRTILRGFGAAEAPAASAREHFGVLYRVEPLARGQAVRVLVQSRVAPDWSPIANHLHGYFAETRDDRPNPATKEIGHIVAGIDAGHELAFRLRANPTRRIHSHSATERSDSARWAGKRVELRTEPEWLAWLERKGSDGGFALERVRARAVPSDFLHLLGAADRPPTAEAPFDVLATPHAKVTGHKRGQGAHHALTLASVLFEGRLRVTNAERFRETLLRGIGSGKAYGFGLLSIAPPTTERGT